MSISLAHERQTGVRCLGWRPASGQSLAVGGQLGVCLWNISTRPVFQNSIAIGKSNEISALSASLTFLRTDSPVTSLAWSANGRLLATICEGSSDIQVWDPALGTATPLRPRFLLSDHLTFVRWSPCGNYLAAATSGKSFHIWETHNWRHLEWTCGARLADAVWGANDRFLVAAFEGSARAVVLQFAQEPPSLNMHVTPLELPGLSPLQGASARGENPAVGIRSMSWDQRGENLALAVSRGGNPAEGVLNSVESILHGDIGNREGSIQAMVLDSGWKHLALAVRGAEGTEHAAVYALQTQPIVKAALLGRVHLDA